MSCSKVMASKRNGEIYLKIKLRNFKSKSDGFPPLLLFAFFSKTKNIAKLNGLLHIKDAQDLAQDLAQDDKYAEMHPGYVVNFQFRLSFETQSRERRRT